MLLHMNLCGLCRAYVLGQLDGVERIRFRRHLSRCPRCQSEVRELAELMAWVKADFAPARAGAPADRHPARSIGSRRPSLSLRQRYWLRRWWSGFAASVLFASLTTATAAPLAKSPRLHETVVLTSERLHKIAIDSEEKLDRWHARLDAVAARLERPWLARPFNHRLL